MTAIRKTTHEVDMAFARERARASQDKKTRAIALLAAGIEPSVVATRLGISAPTIYRLRNEYRKGRTV